MTGRIASVFAADRPRLKHDNFVPRPWHVRSWDYGSHDGRQIPMRDEVGWQLDGGYFTAWQGMLIE